VIQNDAQIGQTEHVSSLPHQDAPLPFDRAIRLLCPSGQYRAIEALFDGRVGYETLKHWRRGRRRAPAWAYEKLAVMLEVRARQDSEVAGLVRAASKSIAQIGKGSHRNICKWNQQRNRLIRE
jgi:hypothetical protein